MSESSNRWYKANREEVAGRRKERYDSDPEYREKVVRRSQDWRDRQPIAPELEEYPIGFSDAAAKLGLKYWQLNEWRKKSYFPEPFVFNGRPYFKVEQLDLLNRIKKVLEETPEDIDNVVAMTYANW